MLNDLHFTAIADAAPFPMWRSDKSGKCTLLNTAWEDLTGQSRQNGMGDGWQALIHPQDLERLQQRFAEATNAGGAYQVEYRVRARNQNYRWVLDSATPRYDGNGAFLGYVGSLLDISDRKQTEDRLADAERRLRIATQAAGLGIWEWDIVADRFTLSQRAATMLGLPLKPIYKRSEIHNVVHPADVEVLATHSAKALDHTIQLLEPYHYRIIVPRNGDIRWIRAHGEAIFDQATKQAIRYIGTFEDVTDTHIASQALQESEAKLRLALDAGEIVLWELDLDSNAVSYSPELNRLFGLPSTLRPTLEDLHNCYALGEQERLARLGEEAQARGETAIATELEHIWPNGGASLGAIESPSCTAHRTLRAKSNRGLDGHYRSRTKARTSPDHCKRNPASAQKCSDHNSLAGHTIVSICGWSRTVPGGILGAPACLRCCHRFNGRSKW